MKTRIRIYLWLMLIGFLIIGAGHAASVARLYEAEKTSVRGDFLRIINKQGFYPSAFGQCLTEKDGVTYRISCASLLTEKQLSEFRESKSFK